MFDLTIKAQIIHRSLILIHTSAYTYIYVYINVCVIICIYIYTVYTSILHKYTVYIQYIHNTG